MLTCHVIGDNTWWEGTPFNQFVTTCNTTMIIAESKPLFFNFLVYPSLTNPQSLIVIYVS